MDSATKHAARALALFPQQPSAANPDEPAQTKDLEPERLRLELLMTEIAFYQDQAGFLAGGGGDQLRTLAERLTETAKREADDPGSGFGG